MKQDDVDTLAWIIGVAMLSIGTGFEWGWPASFIAVGAIFAVWPLVKAAIRASRP